MNLRALERKLGHVARMPPLLTFLLLVSLSLAAGEALYPVPPDRLRVNGEAVTIVGTFSQDTFVPGLGWLSGSSAPPPVWESGELLLGTDNLKRLGLEPVGAGRSGVDPTTAAIFSRAAPAYPTAEEVTVRFGGDSEVRVVLDLPQLADAATLRHLESAGRMDKGEALQLELPRLHLPSVQPDPYRGVDVTLLQGPKGSRVELRGPTMAYKVFALENPVRLVIDVVPLRERHIVPTRQELARGVTYKTFGAPTEAGTSLVHVLEIAPGSGEFRVVGTSEVARTLSELADGAFAAINAGYFDTTTFKAIGLLTVDYGLQSLPSRNRASVGFGIAGPVMNRVQAIIDVRVGGRIYRRESERGQGDGVEVHTVPGYRVGSPRMGTLVIEGGRIVANRVGPAEVPQDGFVVVYPPQDRELALVNPGTPASMSVEFQPRQFQSVRYAVEAGPLLLEGGRPAFEPDREAFSRGQRILDAYTQQSAIGIRPDGTVLFVVAEDMKAQDLVPLFMSLGASEAMRLDSGSSATLLAGGKVLNRANERKIVSAIVFLPGS